MPNTAYRCKTVRPHPAAWMQQPCRSVGRPVPDPIGDLTNLAKLVLRLPTEAQALLTIVNAGVIGPERPDRLYAMYQAVDRYGAMGAAITMAAVRNGDRIGLADELGTLTFAEM